MRGEKVSKKQFNDSVHGLIDVDRILLAFIDTPPFQRLRNLLQLGGTSWVYPTACHHRFEHSVGTAHLAGLMMTHLQESQQNLNINEADVLCAKLAGLLHDIGHGPFSHVWDARVLPALHIAYKHERATIDLIDWMIAEYNLMPKLEAAGLNRNHVRIIKEMIYGVLPGEKDKYYSKGNPKSFMYEIISNGWCELDVDKFDYLARDGKALGTFALESASDLQRLIRLTGVLQDNGEWHIAWRDTAASTLANVFQQRHRLHRIAYKHKNSVAAELMLRDAMVAAEAHLGLKEMYGDPSDPTLDVPRFVTLTDHLFWSILFSTTEELRESREILQRVVTRRLYVPVLRTFVGASAGHLDLRHETIEARLRAIVDGLDDVPAEDRRRWRDALLVVVLRFDFCMRDQNPIDKCLFFGPVGEARPGNTMSSMFLPRHFSEVEVRLYSRLGDRSLSSDSVLARAFTKWCEDSELVNPVKL